MSRFFRYLYVSHTRIISIYIIIHCPAINLDHTCNRTDTHSARNVMLLPMVWYPLLADDVCRLTGVHTPTPILCPSLARWRRLIQFPVCKLKIISTCTSVFLKSLFLPQATKRSSTSYSCINLILLLLPRTNWNGIKMFVLLLFDYTTLLLTF